MMNPKDPAQAQDAALEEEKQKQSGANAGDVADIGANVMVEGVGEVIASTAGAVIDGVGTTAGAAVDMAGSVIGGILDGM